MSISISGATTSPVFPSDSTASPSRQAFKQLGQALKSGDLGAAKTAYASVVKNAPEGATWNPGSAFAQVGKSLGAGDLEGAKSAFKAALQNGHAAGTQQPITATDAPILTTSSSLNLVA